MRWISGMVTAVMAVVILGVVVALGSGSAGAAENCSGPEPAAGSGALVLCLDPEVASSAINTDHTITVTILADPVEGVVGNMTARVTVTGAGPLLVYDCVVAVDPAAPPLASYACSFTYSRAVAGEDSIVGTIVDESNVGETATKTWTDDSTPTPTPTPTATPTATPTPPPAVAPTIVTTSNPTGGDAAPNTSATDTATVGGDAGPADGSVTFFICTPAEVTAEGCPDGAGTQVGAGAVALIDGEATSDSAPSVSALGKYCWRVVYTSTDEDYLDAAHTNADSECFTVRKFASKVETVSQPNGADAIAPGTSVTDLATVTSGEATEPATPGGTVRFFLCAPQPVATACTSGGTAVGGAITLNGSGVAESAPTAPTAEGVYCWRAEYSGDAVYDSSVHTNTTTECFTVRRQTLDIQTTSTPNNGDVDPGTSATDKATIKGSYGMPTGTVTFLLCAPSQVTPGQGCVSGGSQVGSPVALAAGSTVNGISTATAQSVAATSTHAGGTYCWRAEYSGDAVYWASSHTNATTECFTVEPWYLPAGAFVIGDQVGASPVGKDVTFWGAQWWKKNTLSKGSAPGNSVASFKGFANSTSFPFTCGGTWASDPGNSSGPPAGPLPLKMAVIVTDTVQKPGSLITGTIKKIVLVKTNPGYGPNPGHAGTGKVERVICSS